MTTTTIGLREQQDRAVNALADLDVTVWYETATAFTCTEAEVIGEFLRAFVGEAVAEQFIESHSEGDDIGDSHYVLADG